MKDACPHPAFNSAAAAYHATRPRYPEALFDALAREAGLRAGSRLLEIGPGTGQATEPLARRGYSIIAIELGDDLAAIARAALAQYPNVQIRTGAFEDAELPPQSFDLVYAATSLHWVTQEHRFSKPYMLLKKDGCLAIISTHHISDDEDDAFFFASQPIYRKYRPGGKHDDSFRLPKLSDVQAERMDGSLFAHVFFGIFPITIRYSSRDYAMLLSTYSPVLAMDPALRARFLGEIESLIERDFGGSIQKRFGMSLTIGKKR